MVSAECSLLSSIRPWRLGETLVEGKIPPYSTTPWHCENNTLCFCIFVGLMRNFEAAKFNHDYSGRLANLTDVTRFNLPAGYQAKHRKLTLGHGPHVYNRASALLLNFQAINTLPWIKVVPSTPDSSILNKFSEGATIATHCQFFNTPFWSLNPCRVVSFVRRGVYTKNSTSAASRTTGGTSTVTLPKSNDLYPEFRNNNSRNVANGVFSEVVFSTLKGHMIAGEEAFRVYTETVQTNGGAVSALLNTLRVGIKPRVSEHDIVVFEIASFSKGNGVVGRLCMPLLRLLQDKFMADCCAAMRRCVHTLM